MFLSKLAKCKQVCNQFAVFRILNALKIDSSYLSPSSLTPNTVFVSNLKSIAEIWKPLHLEHMIASCSWSFLLDKVDPYIFTFKYEYVNIKFIQFHQHYDQKYSHAIVPTISWFNYYCKYLTIIDECPLILHCWSKATKQREFETK